MELDPEEADLFKGLSSFLCLAMVQQATTSHNLTAFLVNLRRLHYAKFLHPAVMEGQKAKLLSSPIFSPDLFDQEVVAKVQEQFSGNAVTSGNLSVTSWFAKEFLKKQATASSSVASLAASTPRPGTPLVPPATASTSSSYTRPAKQQGKGGWHKKGKGKGPARGKGPRGGYAPAASKQDLPK